MSELLSADRIAELFDAARQGEVPEATARAAGRRAPRLRPVDFTRPTKFTAEQERRFGRATEAFCRSASTRLSAELRAPLDLELINTSQLNWAHAHGQLAAGSLCALLGARPAGTMLLLGVETPLVLHAIELLLGGRPDTTPPRERRLTEIDWALAGHFLEIVVGQLSAIWSDMAGLELGLDRLERQLETAQAAPVSEPTLALTMEARAGRTSATLTLLVPHASVAGVIGALGGEDGAAAEPDPSLRAVVGGAVRQVGVPLRAEVAAVDLPLDEVLALRPGDLLRLDAPAGAGATLCAGEVPVCRVRPGRSGRRRAVQVLGGAEAAP
jgi:flagellar motor switch protein FliM